MTDRIHTDAAPQSGPRPLPSARDGGKARELYLLLKQDISSGAYPLGSRLPSELRLADAFSVSRVTVRRALQALVEDGLIEKRVGAGSVVRGGAAAPLRADVATLMPQLVEMGARSSAQLLSFSYETAPPQIAADLGLTEGALVQTAIRVRSAEGRPFSHLTTRVPAEIARGYDEADLATAPLFRLLERGGVRIASADQSVSATLATPDVAEALDVAVGSALLSLIRVVRDADGRGVEHLSALYRPDRFRLEMELSRVGEGGARHWEPVIGSAEDTA